MLIYEHDKKNNIQHPLIFFAPLLLAINAGYCMANVQVNNAWIKLAPPNATTNAAYMQISNPEVQTQTIVGISTDCCAMAMLHQMQYEGDKVSMAHLDQLIIPAKSSVQLAPGGMHIMLMQARETLSLNRQVAITLEFSDGHSQTINLTVKKDDQ